jgi:hypothetical protein
MREGESTGLGVGELRYGLLRREWSEHVRNTDV